MSHPKSIVTRLSLPILLVLAAGCAEAVEKLRAMTFEAMPPDSQRALGGRKGPLFMIRMVRP